MPLRPDLQNILEIFIFNNLPLLTNPSTAQNAVFSNAIIPTPATMPTPPITPLTPNQPTTPSTTSAPVTPTTNSAVTSPASTPSVTSTPPTVLVITPEVLLALQAAALNNFTDLGLRPDLDDIARVFFANLPPVLRTLPPPQANTVFPLPSATTATP